MVETNERTLRAGRRRGALLIPSSAVVLIIALVAVLARGVVCLSVVVILEPLSWIAMRVDFSVVVCSELVLVAVVRRKTFAFAGFVRHCCCEWIRVSLCQRTIRSHRIQKAHTGAKALRLLARHL
jgi:hypothetical protein